MRLSKARQMSARQARRKRRSYLVDVHQVDAREGLDLVRHARQQLVHAHAGGVVVAAKADDDNTRFLGEDGLVDGVGVVEVGEEVAHFVWCCWGLGWEERS